MEAANLQISIFGLLPEFYMPNRPLALIERAQAAIKYIARTATIAPEKYASGHAGIQAVRPVALVFIA
jgi:hypothetical protein